MTMIPGKTKFAAAAFAALPEKFKLPQRKQRGSGPVQPVKRAAAMSRHERRDTGISARQQRCRRVNFQFPVELGTRRGLRKYLNVLSRMRRVTSGFTVVKQKSEKQPNRAEQRWLERWWSAEAEQT